MSRSLLVVLLASAAAVSAAAIPATANAETASVTTSSDGTDGAERVIIVTGRLFSATASAIGTPVVLSGDALDRNVRPQLGDMLASLPGVSASSFAPGASRPVLRGFDAARVRLLIDGVGSLDASTVSADHAVAIDTLSVERIEVLHGPQVLLYAGDPAGGAVNVVDRRIPRTVPEKGYAVDATASYGSAADSMSLGAAVDLALAPRLVAHVDASWARGNDIRTGGAVLSAPLRADVLANAATLRVEGDSTGADQLTQIANLSGRIPNSSTRNTTLGAGIAFIDAGGDLGVSVERFNTTYGIPPRPRAGAPSAVSIALAQTRIDTRGGVNLGGGFLRRIEFRGAYGEYQHEERDGGVTGATFLSKGLEARLETIQNERGGWRGRSGVQFGDRSLRVVSDERLIPDNATRNFAAFTLQQLRLGSIDLEVAGRFENVRVRAKPAGPVGAFDLWSGVAGAAWHATDSLTFHVDLQRGARAPSAEELFVDGIHEASQSYQVGNAAFTVERSTGVEGGARFQSGNLLLSAIGFTTDFDNFITPVPTGSDVDGYPVYQFTHAKARFYGVEAEGSVRVGEWGERSLTVDAGADYTHANLIGIGPVPRIPPLRLRSGLEWGSPNVTLRGDVEWNARQSRVAAFETQTAPFTLVGISATLRPMGKDGPLTLIASAENLLNVVGRRAASETRDYVPIAGRDMRITAAFRF